jgi:nicotinamidase-related amidase
MTVMLMQRERSQVLLVDMQDRLLEAMPDKTELIERSFRLIRAAQVLGIPITVSEQYPKGLGATAQSLREVLGNEAVVLDKVEFSCFGNEAIRERLQNLRRQGRSQIVVAGIEAHICVAQTAIELVEHGYETFVAADAAGSRDKQSRKLALQRLARQGAEIVDTEMVLFEWLEKAGTPEFKELQALVK